MRKFSALGALLFGLFAVGLFMGCIYVRKSETKVVTQKIVEVSPNETKISQDAKRKNVQLPSYPWHMINLWWNFKDTTANFERIDLDVTIHEDVPESYNLYISPMGIALINNISCYGGLQTNINGWSSKESRKREHFGKGAIFSRWNIDETKPIGLDYIDMVPGGLCESAGYEGEFCSIRCPVKWTAGSYTYSIVKGETIQFKGSPHTWFKCELTSHKDNKTTLVGSLLFEGDTFTFWNRNSAFMEIYSTEELPASDVPEVTVDFAYPRINGSKPPLASASGNYITEGVAASPFCADVKVQGDVISVTVGPEVKDVLLQNFPLSLQIQ